MPLDITCYHCGKSFRVSDDVAGKHFRCVGCQGVLKAPDLPVKKKQLRSGPAARAPQQEPARRKSDRLERPAPSPPGSRPPRRPEPVFHDYDEDPHGYDGPTGVSYQDMPGGPVGQPKRKPKAKPKTRQVTLRTANPDAFVEYDSIMNEIAIFWIGLATITGGFAVLLSTAFWDGAGDHARQRSIVALLGGVATSMFVIGFITFTKSKIWLYTLFFICALYMLATLLLAILVGCSMWVPFVGFCLMYVRMGKALSAHP